MEDIIKKCLPTYEIIRKLGEGVNGIVYQVRDNLKERAVKVVPIMVERSLSYRTPKDLDSKISHDFHAVQEYYSKIKGQGVVEIYDFHLVDKRVSKQEAKAYLVLLMEYCPYNLLNRVLDNHPLPPASCLGLMQMLARVLAGLSKTGQESFIVKDLKPSNLLLNKEGKLLVGDLGGLQRLSSASDTGRAQFTPNWSAPEILEKSENAGLRSLVYSYGFVSYFIWFGSLPYEKEDFTERTRLIRSRGLEFSRTDMPEKIQRLISACLNFDQDRRPSDFNEILEMLNSPWSPGPAEALHSTPKKRAEKSSGRPSALHKHTGSASKESGRKRPEMHKPGDIWLEPVTGMEFVWVPSGEFEMGCGSWDGEGNRDEYPVHKVYIDGFWMGKYPVVQVQWKRVMSPAFWKVVKASNPSWFKSDSMNPVEQVSWHDAMEFIQKLISLNKGRYHFRLPTEAEWEYAARSAGGQEKFSGGRELEELAWYYTNSSMKTRPVGMKRPNQLGLYDMSGNVYEWCLDVYKQEAYKKHAGKNPVVQEEGSRRVIRGGSWSNSPHELRCAYRAAVNPDFKGNYIGLRVVMTPVSRKMNF